MTTEPTGTTPASAGRVDIEPGKTEPGHTGPANQRTDPVSLATALWPWGARGARGAGDLAEALSRAVEVVGNAPGVVRASVRCPAQGSEMPRVAVVVTDPDDVRRLAQRQAHRVTDGWVQYGTSRDRTGLVELDCGPTWFAVLDGIEVFVYTDHQADHQGEAAS